VINMMVKHTRHDACCCIGEVGLCSEPQRKGRGQKGRGSEAFMLKHTIDLFRARLARGVWHTAAEEVGVIGDQAVGKVVLGRPKDDQRTHASDCGAKQATGIRAYVRETNVISFR